MGDPPPPSRRSVMAATALGISSVALPGAAASASELSVSGWSSTLTFSAVGTDGFTVTWDPVG